MFERFTQQAREVVQRARTEAHQMGHSRIGPEHLLLGVLTQPGAPGATTLLRLGVTAEVTRRDAAHLAVTPELSAADADALQTLGIDLGEVTRRVEQAFGPGALDPPRRTRRRWLHWRRHQPEPVGHIPFTPRAKHTLEYALRQAIARKDRHIGVEHVVLGLLAFKDTAVVELLRRQGVTPAAARSAVLTDLTKAA